MPRDSSIYPVTLDVSQAFPALRDQPTVLQAFLDIQDAFDNMSRQVASLLVTSPFGAKLSLANVDPNSIQGPLSASATGIGLTTAQIFLQNLTFSDNTPVAGSVTWTSFTAWYNGTRYSIVGGNSALRYLYWDAGSLTLTDSATFTSLMARFLVATNVSGTADEAWNKIANKGVVRGHLGFMFSEKQDFTVSGTYTVPDETEFVYVMVCGGGGAGGGSTSISNGAGGGASGRIVYGGPISVTPGASITVTVGAGGPTPADGANGTAGDASSFGTLVVAAGGDYGRSGAAGGAGGASQGTSQTLGSIGTWATGAGANRTTSYGGGGGAIGTDATSTVGTGAIPSPAVVPFGAGNGGAGHNTSADGSPAAANSGAGGGGGGGTVADTHGGAGGSGRVTVWW